MKESIFSYRFVSARSETRSTVTVADRPPGFGPVGGACCWHGGVQ